MMVDDPHSDTCFLATLFHSYTGLLVLRHVQLGVVHVVTFRRRLGFVLSKLVLVATSHLRLRPLLLDLLVSVQHSAEWTLYYVLMLAVVPGDMMVVDFLSETFVDPNQFDSDDSTLGSAL